MATAKTQDRGFLNFFWDLASEDSDKRVKAGEGIVAHLTAAKSSGKATVNDDIEYALKRLIRGLSSSREAARQGFAGCLCELLKSQQQFDFDFVVKLLDESTQITGSMKGNEERDALFGKLFGCLCLIRAGMVDSDGAVKTVLDTLLDVQTRKPWIREVCAEALLLLVSECSDPTVVAIILPPVVELIGTAPMEDLSAWQLQLIGGIELAVAAREGLHAHVAPALRHLGGKVTSAASLPTIAPTLVAATSGFPKIHRVYGTLLAGVFRSDKDRVLLPDRYV
jgi:DNA polymerase phi